MNVIKKVNTMFISLIVGIIYVFIIGLAWILHKVTQHIPSTAESYWLIPEKKKLPKHLFSSPY